MALVADGMWFLSFSTTRDSIFRLLLVETERTTGDFGARTEPASYVFDGLHATIFRESG
jgi:hypothetical protein